MKRLAVLLIIVGVLVAGYPLAEQAYTWYRQQQLLSAWEEGLRTGTPDRAPTDGAADTDADAQPEAAGPVPIGVLIIDKIDMRLPILDGTGGDKLWLGAGVWERGASLGAEGNTVIVSHRVHTFGRLFNRLDELAPGDAVVLETPGGGYRYTVYERQVVRADRLTLARAGAGESLLTLVTCHPLNRVNSPDRLVVKARAVGTPRVTSG